MNTYYNFSIRINQAIKEASNAIGYEQVAKSIRKTERAYETYLNDCDVMNEVEYGKARYKFLGTLDWLRHRYDQLRYN